MSEVSGGFVEDIPTKSQKGNKKIGRRTKKMKKETKDKTQIAHTINKVNCTQMNQPNHPNNSTINLYTRLRAVQHSLSPRIASGPQPFTPRCIETLNPS